MLVEARGLSEMLSTCKLEGSRVARSSSTLAYILRLMIVDIAATIPIASVLKLLLLIYDGVLPLFRVGRYISYTTRCYPAFYIRNILGNLYKVLVVGLGL